MITKILVYLGSFVFYLKKTFNKLISVYLFEMLRKQSGYFGKDIKINGVGTITGLNKFRISDNVHIGNNYFFRCEGGLSIGINTHISRNVTIYTHNHNYEGKYLPYDETYVTGEVLIRENVWIGMNVFILPGVEIGEGAIIGAGSIVSKSIKPYSIAVGNPARVVKTRNVDRYQLLKKNSLYSGVSGRKYVRG